MASKLRIGTGGIPFSAKDGTTEAGIRRLRELGLEHMELEFVRSVYFSEEQASTIKEVSEEADISLSVHGSYFVNLAAKEKQKWHAGINRIAKGARVGSHAGASFITFHSGFFMKQDPDVVLKKIRAGVTKIFEELGPEHKIKIAPELTGKKSQFGSMEELVELYKYFQDTEYADRIGFCIDFAHLHARNIGEYADKDSLQNFLATLVNALGEDILTDMYMHFSAIEYSERGERNHLTFLDSREKYLDFGIDIAGLEEEFSQLESKGKMGGGEQDWKGLMEALKENGVRGYLVCESPVLEADAELLQKYYAAL